MDTVCTILVICCLKSIASSVAAAMHWTPFQIVMPITKGMVLYWSALAETRIFSMAICPDCVRALVDWHHFGTSLFYLTYLNFIL